MELTAFLSADDARRAEHTLGVLARHEIEPLALTGGLAIEMHCVRRGLPADMRPLNDIDFVASTFSDIAQTLDADFIFRHVHPCESPGKMLVQCVDAVAALRVDIFRACGNTMARTEHFELYGRLLRVVSLADLAARAARLCMDLAAGVAVPAKHARDFLRLLPLVNLGAMEPVWQEHRKAAHPDAFAETANLLANLIATTEDLLITPVYSRDTTAACPRCVPTTPFSLADAGTMLALLGYC